MKRKISSNFFNSKAGIFIVIGFASISSVATASTYEVTLCDNCSGSQYGQAAVDVGCPNAIDVYVVNRPDQVIKAFHTLCSYDPEFVWERAFEIEGDPAVIDDIDAVLDFIAAVKSLDTVPFAGLPMPPDSGGVNGALDIVRQAGMSQVQIGIENYIEVNFYPMLIGIFLHPSSLMSLLSGNIATKSFTLEFPNGSSYKFTVEFSVNVASGEIEVLSITPVVGSGRDAEGNAIPETELGFHGIFRNGPVAPGYRPIAQGLGIPVQLYTCLPQAEFSCDIQGSHLQCQIHLAC